MNTLITILLTIYLTLNISMIILQILFVKINTKTFFILLFFGVLYAIDELIN